MLRQQIVCGRISVGTGGTDPLPYKRSCWFGREVSVGSAPIRESEIARVENLTEARQNRADYNSGKYFPR